MVSPPVKPVIGVEVTTVPGVALLIRSRLFEVSTARIVTASEEDAASPSNARAARTHASLCFKAPLGASSCRAPDNIRPEDLLYSCVTASPPAIDRTGRQTSCAAERAQPARDCDLGRYN